MTAIDPRIMQVVASDCNRSRQRFLRIVPLLLVVAAAFCYSDAFNVARYVDALPILAELAGDAWPPDFGRCRHWGRPLLDTLSMSLAGTVLGALFAVPCGFAAARSLSGAMLYRPTLLFLNILRAIPGLVWGIFFVAAVGFGPLPGIFALACHSCGVIGKLCAEALEHLEPHPAAAMRSQGVSAAGVIRFCILPQILPRLMDAVLYRFEHNVRAAVTLGVIGAGGLGLEIVTAFHLFQYREAFALILVLFGLVTAINMLAAGVRGKLLGNEIF